MFDRYQVSNLVKNKELLRSFHFERVFIEDRFLLKITKTSGRIPLVFVVDMELNAPAFWSLLRQGFFPSSVSILTRLGKRFLQSYQSNFEDMMLDARIGTAEYQYYFSNNNVRDAILSFFRYKKISLRLGGYSTYVPYFRDKENVELISQAKHPLIRYFRDMVFRCQYEKTVFDAVVKLFQFVENERDAADKLLELVSLTGDDMVLNAMFIQSDQTVTPCNYGRALNASYRGDTVLSGTVPWSTLMRSANRIHEALQPTDLASGIRSQVSRMSEIAQAQSQNVLTNEAASHYNRRVPEVCFWGLS